MGSSKAPPAPDYVGAATVQGAANKEIANLARNMGFKKVKDLKEINAALYVSKADNCKWLILKVKCYGII